jgi:hypothetical protein
MRAAAIVLALGLAFAFLEQLHAAEEVKLTVRPAGFAFEGSDIEVQIRVLVDPERTDRLLEIVVDGAEYHRTIRSVDERISTQRSIWLRNPAPGTYRVTVRLLECSADGCGELETAARVERETAILAGVPRAR